MAESFFLHLQENVLQKDVSQLQMMLFRTESGVGFAFGGIITAVNVDVFASSLQPNWELLIVYMIRMLEFEL